MKKDVSILIVHYNTQKLLRQTLKGIFSTPSRVSFEVIVVDNNPLARIAPTIQSEFPQVKWMISEQNIGFGRGMNLAMKNASGRYLFVFNPDIIFLEHALDRLTEFMDAHKDVGIAAPKLLNPDTSLQYSCYRFMGPWIIFFRRFPFLSHVSFVKKKIDRYLMKDWDHESVQDVDYVLGAAMFVRREAYEQVGGFDPNFFIYFEDQDWCRRFWVSGWRVTYVPDAKLMHYHRRETADGSFFSQLFNPLTRKQMKSAIYYYKKYHGQQKSRMEHP